MGPATRGGDGGGARSQPSYDTIGRGYRRARRSDPRLQARIHRALGDAHSVVNVGAGSGSYEPRDRFVVGVDPSPVMLDQRDASAGPAVRGVAERLPFRDDAFEAALAILTLHHWADLDEGLAELRRVAGRQVVFMFDAARFSSLWLLDYFPEIMTLPSEARAPTSAAVAARLDTEHVEVVPVPADCLDGFGGAYWNRPDRYLDPEVQAGISGLALLPPPLLERGCRRLRHDLDHGVWDARHGHLRSMSEIDLGYRLVVGLPAGERSL